MAGLALLVVDAANVVGSRPDGWWRDRAGAAARLVESLRQGVGEPYDITVVLEGAARKGVPPGDEAGLRVVHAANSGDDTIVDVVASAREADAHREILVITADRELRRRVEEFDARTTGPSWLRERLDGTTPSA
ncbi:hypothetical protein OG394_23125 [Kribbella sp. NBC_01245]|uniref:hypothetical protein n=1 Tax=Kribbella sp. NBC_01245 TaxID=2903578 RepID=UPI002E2903AA|nr:hypothetical protein [Kribbella sp. NBC_01245]